MIVTAVWTGVHNNAKWNKEGGKAYICNHFCDYNYNHKLIGSQLAAQMVNS